MRDAVWGVVWPKEVGSEVSSSEGDVDVVSFHRQIVEMDGSR